MERREAGREVGVAAVDGEGAGLDLVSSGTLTACSNVPYPPFEEQAAPLGSYNPPAEDGSRPGIYRINLFEAEKQPRAAIQSTAFHEATPGHHVQIAIAQELEGTHQLQRLLSSGGFVEGWGLYAERLADEMAVEAAPSDAQIRRWAAAWGRTRLRAGLRIAAARWAAERLGGGAGPTPARVRSVYRRAIRIAFRDPIELGDLAVDGEDLRDAGIPAGPLLGKILHALLAWVIEAGWLISVSTPPRLSASAHSVRLLRNSRARSTEPSSNETMPPYRFIWREATACPGCSARPG